MNLSKKWQRPDISMKAMLLSKYRHLEIAELPRQPRPGELLVKVAACGICGSDVHGYDGSSGRRIPPIVMGHEASGLIAGLGPQASGWSEGDRVTFDSTISCGTCPYCARGEINLCDRGRSWAFPARIIAAPELSPNTSSFHSESFIACRISSLFRKPPCWRPLPSRCMQFPSPEFPGDKALVLGAGMIGLLCLQALRAAGCSTVYIADVDASRLRLAKEIGATETLHATGDKLVAEILSRTSGAGVDVAVEAVGVDATVRSAVHSVRKGGQLLW